MDSFRHRWFSATHRGTLIGNVYRLTLIKVTDFDANHVQLKIEDQIVLMRKGDYFLNAGQILKLTDKAPNDIDHLLQLMKQRIHVEVFPAIERVAPPSFWVSFESGQVLCKQFDLEQKLQPLLDYRHRVHSNDLSNSTNSASLYSIRQPMFYSITVASQKITVRSSDFKIRINDIRWSSRTSQNSELAKIRSFLPGKFVIVSGWHRGTYLDLWNVINLCMKYGLHELEKAFSGWDHQVPPPEFVEIQGFATTVRIRRSDFRVNAHNIFKLAGRQRHCAKDLRERIGREAYDIVNGKGEDQGTYVRFDIGVEMCQEYGLNQLKQLLETTAAKLGQAGYRDQTLEQLPTSPGTSSPNETMEGSPSWIADASSSQVALWSELDDFLTNDMFTSNQ